MKKYLQAFGFILIGIFNQIQSSDKELNQRKIKYIKLNFIQTLRDRDTKSMRKALLVYEELNKDKPEEITKLVDKQYFKGRAALHFTVSNNDIPKTTMLLQFGADVNIADSENKTPLYYAMAQKYKNHQMINILIDAGALIEDDYLKNLTGNLESMNLKKSSTAI
jgi:ankyrin repeat protein